MVFAGGVIIMTVFFDKIADKIAAVAGYISLISVVCIFLVGLWYNAVDWFWAPKCSKCGARLKDKV
jgi:hypothetical protein